MKPIAKVALGLALGVGLIGALPGIAAAQDDPGGRIIPSLEYQQADVREALRALFRTVGVDYSIAPDVQGLITVSLRNVPFETALQAILRQVDATYRIEAGIYQIVRRIDPAPVTPQLPGEIGVTPGTERRPVRLIRIGRADPRMIAALIGADRGLQDWGMPPETSTVVAAPGGGGMGGMGGGMGGMGGGMGGFGGGMGGMGGGMGGGGFGGGMGGMGGGMGGMGGGMGGGLGGGGGMGGGGFGR
jgi:hypothetical protein